jgi:hypothetical protein
MAQEGRGIDEGRAGLQAAAHHIRLHRQTLMSDVLAKEDAGAAHPGRAGTLHTPLPSIETPNSPSPGSSRSPDAGSMN